MIPRANAPRTDTWPVTKGLCAVLSIKASISRSTTLFNAFAPPAANAPPTRVANTKYQLGHPLEAKNIVGTVVTRSNSIILGFVKET